MRVVPLILLAIVDYLALNLFGGVVVPNIDRDRSAMVGYSNGAIAVAILISSHDRYILDQFHSFCLVDHGMFHLTDLHKPPANDRRYLILVGDRDDYGREFKLRGAKLAEDSNQSK